MVFWSRIGLGKKRDKMTTLRHKKMYDSIQKLNGEVTERSYSAEFCSRKFPDKIKADKCL